MANYNCEACEDLRQTDPNLIVNGFGDEECASLQNDTGLVPSSGHDDCEDLNNLNDCLVGNMETEVEAYDVCDWKTFMKKFIPNVWTTIKGIICAICGIWTNIHNLWDKIAEILKQIDKILCMINSMSEGATFEIGEEPTGNSYVVAGKGISFYQGGGAHYSNIYLTYIAGGLMLGGGSCIWHTSNFTDARSVVNFDNGSVERTSSARKGNSYWGKVGRPASNGELIYEIRIKRSAYPQIGTVFTGFGIETGGSAYRVTLTPFEAGSYAYGQHGGCNPSTGAPDRDGYDRGHLVPDGWLYLQLRMTYADMKHNDGTQYTPRYMMGVRMNLEASGCE